MSLQDDSDGGLNGARHALQEEIHENSGPGAEAEGHKGSQDDDMVDDDYFDQDNDGAVDEEALQALLTKEENRELLKRWAGIPVGADTENTKGMPDDDDVDEDENKDKVNISDSEDDLEKKRKTERPDLANFQVALEAYSEKGQMDKLT